MKKIKFLLAVMLLVAAAVSVQAQSFEWVRTYSGIDRYDFNEIRGSFVDAQGNTYIVGNISAGGEILGVDILPIEVDSSHSNDRCVVIAKISPDGQLVWHKPIYTSGRNNEALALKRMGDSAFMVMFNLTMLHRYYGIYDYVYFIDTILRSPDSGYLTMEDSTFCTRYVTFFITFDLDGNVLERHRLEAGYIDDNGNDVTYGFRMNMPSASNANALFTDGLFGTFTIGHDGNIYVVRSTVNDIEYMRSSNDSTYTISIKNGTISALKIMVDGRRPLVHQLDMPAPMWNQQILKFTPHFDSLIGGVYMFDSTYRNAADIRSTCTSVNIDRHDNIYVSAYVIGKPSLRTYINNSDSLSIRTIETGLNTFVAVYNSDLRAIEIIQPVVDDNDSSTQISLGNYFGGDIYFDEDSNSIFVQGSVGSFTGQTNFLYKGDTIPIPIDSAAFWLRLDMDSLNLLSYGYARPPRRGAYVEMNHVAAKNNKVFAQVKFKELVFADTTLITPYGDDMAFVVWDYEGNELLVKNYNVSNLLNHLGYIHIVDSAVYLTGMLHEGATFDTIAVQGTGYSQAYVARYVDTSLIHREEQSIIWTQELDYRLGEGPVVLTATSTSGLPVSYISCDNNVVQVRGDTLVFLTIGTATVTARQEGDARYAAAEPVSKTLRVRADGIDEAATEGLTLYPNPTTGVVQVGCDGCTVKEAAVISTLGHRERVACRDGRIDLSHLAAGVYYLEVRTDTGVARGKITKL